MVSADLTSEPVNFAGPGLAHVLGAGDRRPGRDAAGLMLPGTRVPMGAVVLGM